MAYYLLEPEVAGELGDGTIMDTSTHPPVVTRLQYELHGWLGDELLESFPCFIVSSSLAKVLSSSGLTGFALADVEVVLSEEFRDFDRDGAIPEFRWLQLTGRAQADDFGADESGSLIVSDAGLAVLRRGRLENCDIEGL